MCSFRSAFDVLLYPQTLHARRFFSVCDRISGTGLSVIWVANTWLASTHWLSVLNLHFLQPYGLSNTWLAKCFKYGTSILDSTPNSSKSQYWQVNFVLPKLEFATDSWWTRMGCTPECFNGCSFAASDYGIKDKFSVDWPSLCSFICLMCSDKPVINILQMSHLYLEGSI